MDVAEPAEHDGEADPGELVGDDRPRDAENVGVERVGDGGKGDDEAAAGEPRDELPEHRVDEKEPVRTTGTPRKHWKENRLL